MATTTVTTPITVDNPRILTEPEREILLEALTIAAEQAHLASIGNPDTGPADPTTEAVHNMRHAAFADLHAVLTGSDVVLGDVIFDLDALD